MTRERIGKFISADLESEEKRLDAAIAWRREMIVTERALIRYFESYLLGRVLSFDAYLRVSKLGDEIKGLLRQRYEEPLMRREWAL